MGNRTAVIVACALVGLTVSTPAFADSPAPSTYGRASYLLDESTGKAMISKRADKRVPIASLTKIMTAYVVLGQAKLTDKVRITAKDVRYAERGGATTADLRPGDRLTVKELLYGLMLPSGADAAHALARTYGPGVDGFTAKMNATAKAMGLSNTSYVNADGLPARGGDGYSTARDQARLAAAALRNPTFRSVTSTKSRTVASTADHRAYSWTNTNRMLDAPGSLGVKTGYTRAAGFNLAFAADRKGRRLVGVILGETDSSRRFDTARSLLKWAAKHPVEGNG
ncbi:D-alanyl-D-alanine carboxypeptidase family protein [Nonomuraea sediminis]|uniref:D-alanyl-D-alanine carboxypeptidase family protein n=1 Tax=Nonomuraea sediminis TaxID=2835864 RepID=UPI001BDBC3AA|nr:D-alanyl-D-alanine carboxypeptidase family protein [Nonomuraea sediminis]